MKDSPKYIQIENDIMIGIENRTLCHNEKLPSEDSIAKKYKVSRMTVNKALNNLENKGYIVKRKGIGSFVSSNKIMKTFNQSRSFTDDITLIGKKPSSILVEYKIVKASEIEEIQEILNVSGDTLIHYFCRIRLSDNIKVALSYDYVIVDKIPIIDIRFLSSSFYEFLKSYYGISPLSANYNINALISNGEINKLLEIENKAILKVNHLSYLDTNEVFKYNITYYLGDYFSYKSNSSDIYHTF